MFGSWIWGWGQHEFEEMEDLKCLSLFNIFLKIHNDIRYEIKHKKEWLGSWVFGQDDSRKKIMKGGLGVSCTVAIFTWVACNSLGWEMTNFAHHVYTSFGTNKCEHALCNTHICKWVQIDGPFMPITLTFIPTIHLTLTKTQTIKYMG